MYEVALMHTAFFEQIFDLSFSAVATHYLTMHITTLVDVRTFAFYTGTLARQTNDLI